MKPKSSSKSFGILFFIIFLVIGLWPLINEGQIRLWSLIISFILLIISFVKPNILSPLNYAWIKLGEILGRIVAPIVMFIVFFLVVTPMSFLVRIFGKDLLNLRFNNSKSYWLKKKDNILYMKKQF